MRRLLIPLMILFLLVSLCASSQDINSPGGKKEKLTSQKTSPGPSPEVYLLPGYLEFGTKDLKFGAWGISGGYTHPLGNGGFGITIESGFHKKTVDFGTVNNKKEQLVHGLVGFSFSSNRSPAPPRFSFTTRLLAGLLVHKKRIIASGEGIGETRNGFCLNAGFAINLRLTRCWSLRLLQADYMPAFFEGDPVHCWGAGAGVVYRFTR